VSVELGWVHFFESDGARVRVTTLPSPESVARDARQLDGQLAILGSSRLVLVELSEVPPSTGHAAVSLACEPIRRVAEGEAEPAIALFVFPGRILVEHPTRGRITILRDEHSPPVEKGEALILDDVREDLPGVVTVHAWRKRAGGEGAAATTPAIVLSAPSVQAMTSAQVEALLPPPRAARPGAEHLEALATEHGFLAPPLLLRVLREAEADAVFAGWLDRCGLAYLEVRSLTCDWDADPCLLAFGGNGAGDEFALYLYPPACGPSVEPPVVEFVHETVETEFCASTFEAFLERFLRESASEDLAGPTIVAHVRERLGFPSVDRERGAAPGYLVDLTREELPETHERRLVAEVAQGDPGAFEALLEHCRESGWSYPLSSLVAAIN